MKKTLTILLALLIFGAQQGVASEKRAENKKNTSNKLNRQERAELQRQYEAAAKKFILAVDNGKSLSEGKIIQDINIVAVHEFLQNEGYAPEWRESGEVKYLTLKYQGQGMFVSVDKDYVCIYTGFDNIASFILNHTKQKSLSNRELAHIYQTCIELTQTFRVLKFRYDAEDDVAYMVVESSMPSMAIFKHYFDFYIGALKLAADEFEKSLNEKLGIK